MLPQTFAGLALTAETGEGFIKTFTEAVAVDEPSLTDTVYVAVVCDEVKLVGATVIAAVVAALLHT